VFGARKTAATRRRRPALAIAVGTVAAVALGGGFALTLRDEAPSTELTLTDEGALSGDDQARAIAALAPRPREDLPPADLAPRPAPEEIGAEAEGDASDTSETSSPGSEAGDTALAVVEQIPEAEA